VESDTITVFEIRSTGYEVKPADMAATGPTIEERERRLEQAMPAVQPGELEPTRQLEQSQ